MEPDNRLHLHCRRCFRTTDLYQHPRRVGHVPRTVWPEPELRAARESVEIQTWSTALAFEDGLTRITHHVHAVGEVTGVTPNVLQWALAPTRDYQFLDLLSRALREGVLGL
jgi:hypothetical protein